MKRGRLLRFGLSTLVGWKQRGFFIPYRYADQVTPRAKRPPYEALEPIFARSAETFAAMLRSMGDYAPDLAAIAGPAPEPRWDQDWFPRLDAAALYVLLRETRPARIVEVGSGHSTRFMKRAIKDGALQTAVVAIDPAPRADIGSLGIELIQRPLQDIGISAFSLLEEGDILFIDSSHILMPGTDVDILLNHVLPGLRRGVLVHIHDIFLPEEYPPAWEWRGYNEQLAVATLIQGGAYSLLWSSRYAVVHMPVAVAGSAARTLPLKEGAFESSLWLVKA